MRVFRLELIHVLIDLLIHQVTGIIGILKHSFELECALIRRVDGAIAAGAEHRPMPLGEVTEHRLSATLLGRRGIGVASANCQLPAADALPFRSDLEVVETSFLLLLLFVL